MLYRASRSQADPNGPWLPLLLANSKALQALTILQTTGAAKGHPWGIHPRDVRQRIGGSRDSAESLLN